MVQISEKAAFLQLRANKQNKQTPLANFVLTFLELNRIPSGESKELQTEWTKWWADQPGASRKEAPAVPPAASAQLAANTDPGATKPQDPA